MSNCCSFTPQIPDSVSPIQNIPTKNLETICQVIHAKTSQKMIVNLLMVLIDLPIIKFTYHVSGYVDLYDIWVFVLLIEIITIAKLFIIVHFFFNLTTR